MSQLLIYFLVASISDLSNGEDKNMLFSVVVPVYNVEPYVAKCLETLINQTYKDFEIIIVNDGSKDHTLEQMIKLHNKDNHYNYLNLSRNYGKEIAMMAGIDYVKGDAMITFLQIQ